MQLVRRVLLALVALFTLLCVLRLRTGPAPTFAELAYLGALTCVLGVPPALMLAWSALPLRQALWLVVPSTLSAALVVASQLALADGLRSQAPVWALHALGLVAGGTLLLVAQLSARLVARSRALHGACTALVLALLGGLCVFAPLNRAVLAVLVLAATVLAASVLEHTLALRMARLPWLCAAPVLLLALVALVRPAASQAARRQSLVASAPLEQLDAMLPVFGTRFPGFRVPARAARCAPGRAFQGAERLGLTDGQRRNVLIVTIDTLRADDAALRTERGLLMPNLARFFAGSQRARAAYTGYPATMMALGSAFSGFLPSHALLQKRPPPSIFGALRGRFDDVSAVLPRGRYFERPGIARYILQGATHVRTAAKADQTSATLKRLAALRRANQRHLLWLHYYEPHEPYLEQKGFAFGTSARDRYHSELAALDVKLGRLFGALERMGVARDTLVLVFADHGESFGEHGHAYHHYHLYPWLVRVPFAMRVPGQPAREIAGPVQLADVAATVLDFAGVAPASALDGMSLLEQDPPATRAIVSEEFPVPSSLLERYGSETPDREALAERIAQIERGVGYPSKISLLRGATQLVVHRTGNLSELYRIDRDPGVEHDLAARDPAAVASLREELSRYTTRVSASLACAAQAE